MKHKELILKRCMLITFIIMVSCLILMVTCLIFNGDILHSQATYCHKLHRHRHFELGFDLGVVVDVLLHHHQQNDTHQRCYQGHRICCWNVHEEVAVGLKNWKNYMLCKSESAHSCLWGGGVGGSLQQQNLIQGTKKHRRSRQFFIH